MCERMFLLISVVADFVVGNERCGAVLIDEPQSGCSAIRDSRSLPSIECGLAWIENFDPLRPREPLMSRFSILSVLVLGLLAGIFEFVPLVGPLLIGIIAAVAAMLHSGSFSALMVLVFLAVLRIVQDYVVYPRLIGQGIHLHPLAVIIAILSGAELAGVAGIFLAIPVVAILTVLYRHWLEHRGSEGLADVLEPTSEPEVPEAVADLVDGEVPVRQKN